MELEVGHGETEVYPRVVGQRRHWELFIAACRRGSERQKQLQRQLERSQSSFTMLFAMGWTTQILARPITKSAIGSVSSPISNDVRRRSDTFSSQPRSRDYRWLFLRKAAIRRNR